MKVAQVCPRYHPYIGGVETQVKEISERLAKRNFEVEVLTTDSSGSMEKEEIVNDVKVRRFKSWAPNESYHFSNELRKYLLKNSNRFDIVHAHSYAALPALYAARAKDKNKLVFTAHYHGAGHTRFRSLLHIPYKFWGKSIFEKADHVICVSEIEKNLVERKFNVRTDSISVIPNGVYLEEFKTLKRKRNDCQIILSVGRLEKYKGMQYLIKMLPKLGPRVTLEIVGKGPYHDTLVTLARKMEVSARTDFSQDLSREALLQKYADAAVFALLSEREAYGICVAEALCAGTPCVVARKAALEEWIDNVNCFGIDCPIDLDRLANLVNSTIGKRATNLKISDWSEITEQIVCIYDRVSGLRKG